ncbi:MAG: tannase/feruloyl esterase family alpha/beta hydrolase [Bryobacterales bacterium]
MTCCHPSAQDRVTVCWPAARGLEWPLPGFRRRRLCWRRALQQLPACGPRLCGSVDRHRPRRLQGQLCLDSEGRLDWQAIRNNAHLGIHEMTRVGKAVTAAFYGVAPKYAYFNGCSTGGRQGLMEAQRYPTDYDGILSGCPAINWPKLHVEQLWGPLVMRQSGYTPQACKLEQARTASVAACDALDGVTDGVISHPNRCKFDAQSLVGIAAPGCSAFNAQDAAIVTKIWQGPRRQDGSFRYGWATGRTSAD